MQMHNVPRTHADNLDANLLLGSSQTLDQPDSPVLAGHVQRRAKVPVDPGNGRRHHHDARLVPAQQRANGDAREFNGVAQVDVEECVSVRLGVVPEAGAGLSC